jgi:hypothetical protein
MIISRLALCVLGLLFTVTALADEGGQPLSVAPDLFDQDQPATLGLAAAPGTETLTVFRPGEGDDLFNHGAVVTQFDGRLFVQWQTSAQDEDSPDTHVVYSTSVDGRRWTEPQRIADSPPGAMTTSGGWWQYDGKLIAFINVWPRAGDIHNGGYTTFASTRDGETWSDLSPVLGSNGQPLEGIFEQDPAALPGGRIISAFHLQPGLHVAPFYTDDVSGTNGWTKGRMDNLAEEGPVSRELEPSWYRRRDGAVVMVFRDQHETFRKLASISHDEGETWSQPSLTDVPDARTKQSAGNLPDGTAYLVGNPVGNRSRFPLAVVLSRDGIVFDRAFLLRAGGDAMPPLRHKGRYKRPGYSYPKSSVIGDWLYVAYATNKEDIELTRVPVKELDTAIRR